MEQLSTGVVRTAQTSIGIPYVDSTEYVLGLRFSSVDLERATIVQSALLQMQVTAESLGAVQLQIRAEAADSAPSFSSNSHNITGRNLTSASVLWSPQDYNVVGALHWSADFKAVLQEVVSRPGWQRNNAVVLVIKRYSGDRTRGLCSCPWC